MAPPAKTYRSDLEKALRAAERAGIHLKAVPAMLKLDQVKNTYLRDLANSQTKRCERCRKRGVICEPMNLGGHECFGCLGLGSCEWARCKYIFV